MTYNVSLPDVKAKARTLFPQGLFKDFYRLNSSSVIIHYTVLCWPKYASSSFPSNVVIENSFHPTFRNTTRWLLHLISWHNATISVKTSCSPYLVCHIRSRWSDDGRMCICSLKFHLVTSHHYVKIWEGDLWIVHRTGVFGRNRAISRNANGTVNRAPISGGKIAKSVYGPRLRIVAFCCKINGRLIVRAAHRTFSEISMFGARKRTIICRRKSTNKWWETRPVKCWFYTWLLQL